MKSPRAKIARGLLNLSQEPEMRRLLRSSGDGSFVGAFDRANNHARTDAASACANSLGRAVYDSFHFLKIGEPAGSRLDIGVRNEVSGSRALIAEFTNTCHGEVL